MIKSILFMMINIMVIVAIDSDSFCHFIDKKCESTFDSMNQHQKVCQYEQCLSPYGYQCGQKCSKSKSECTKFQQIEEALNSNLFLNMNRLTFINEKAKLKRKKMQNDFNSLKSKIKNCIRPSLNFSSNDLCIKRKYCFKGKIPNTLNLIKDNNHKEKQSLVRTNCPCDDNYPIDCGDQLCASSKNICLSFISNNLNLNSKEIALKTCGNPKRLIFLN